MRDAVAFFMTVAAQEASYAAHRRTYCFDQSLAQRVVRLATPNTVALAQVLDFDDRMHREKSDDVGEVTLHALERVRRVDQEDQRQNRRDGELRPGERTAEQRRAVAVDDTG